MKNPRRCCTSPWPWQYGQTVGPLPRLAPVPPHSPQSLVAGDLDRLLDAARGLFERQLHLDAPVRARARPAPAAEHLLEKSAPEQVGEVAEDIVHAGVLLAGVRRHALAAEPVVPCALLRVAEDLVRLGRLLELALGLLVARIAVRMVLQRRLAERLLQVIRRRVARHAQNLVIVLFSHQPGSRSGSERSETDTRHYFIYVTSRCGDWSTEATRCPFRRTLGSERRVDC